MLFLEHDAVNAAAPFSTPKKAFDSEAAQFWNEYDGITAWRQAQSPATMRAGKPGPS